MYSGTLIAYRNSDTNYISQNSKLAVCIVTDFYNGALALISTQDKQYLYFSTPRDYFLFCKQILDTLAHCKIFENIYINFVSSSSWQTTPIGIETLVNTFSATIYYFCRLYSPPFNRYLRHINNVVTA